MKSLYVKFALTTIGIMLLSGLVAFMLSNFYYQQKLKPENDEKNTTIALEMAAFIEEESTINLDTYLDNLGAVGYQIMLTDETGDQKYFGASFKETNLSDKIKEKVMNGEVYHGMAAFPQETFVTGFFANELKNTIGVPLTHHNEDYAMFIRPDIKLLFNEIHILLAWLLLFTIILSIILVLISTKYLVNPISKITKATNKLSEGNFNIELDLGRNDEIGQLANSFTHMAKQLDALDGMKNEFISNISHDIQSPLSNIKGYSNLLEKNKPSEAEKKEYISIINKEITRLSNLTKQLLLLASLERQDEIMNKKEYNLTNQLKDMIRNHQWHLEDKGIMISYSLPEISFYGDSSMLYNVWENLLTNAIKYNKASGSINIAAIENEESIEVRFQDTGIGIEETTKERLFDRFYREDAARNRTIEGTGLGLSIVSLIVQLHEGSIEVTSEKMKGSLFTIRLPKLL